ncbi:phage tail tape measure protein [bacterium]|nr:MAG: phage tail tape measure protein [bacterium]
MPRLSGVVDLDTKRAINNARSLRGELVKLASSPTKARIEIDDKAQNTVRKLKNDIRGLTKLGSDHKVRIQATADVKDATSKLGKLGSALKAVGKNPRITITVDLGQATRAQKQLSDAEKQRREQIKQAAQANKQALLDEQRQREANSRRLRDDIKNRAREEQQAIRDAARLQREADRDAKRRADELGAARRRAMSEGRMAAGQLANQGSMAATRGGLLVGAAFGVSLRVFDDYDRKLRNVNSIALLSEGGIQKLSKSVRDLSADPTIRKGPRDLMEGLYDIYSVGIKGKEALDLLESGARSGAAGVTTTKVAVDGLTTVLNAHVKGVKNAKEAADIYFQTVNDGKISFADLVTSVGKSAGLMHDSGTSFQEYGAYMATATKIGQKAAMATVNYNNLVRKIAGPPARAAKAFEALGIKTGYAELKAVGFSKKLEEIGRKTGGNSDLLQKLFPDQRAYQAASTIITNQMKSYNEMLDNQKHAYDGVGAASKAAAAQNKGFSYDVDTAKKNLEEFGLTAAETVAPALSELFKDGNNLLKNFRGLSKETQTSTIKGIAYAGMTLLIVGRLKPLGDTLVMVRNSYLGVRAAQEVAALGGASSSTRIVAGLGRILIGTKATTVGFKTLQFAGIGGAAALGIALGALAATIWGVKTAFQGTQDAGVMAADKLRNKWGIMADIWLAGSDGLNGIINKLDAIANSSAFDRIAQLVPEITIARSALGALKTSDTAGNAAAAKAARIRAFMRGGGGRLASSDPLGDPGITKPTTVPKSTASTGGPLPDLSNLGKKSEAEKAADREAKRLLREQKDAVNDVAKAYEYKAQAAKKSAEIVADTTKKELDGLKSLKDGFAGLFTDAQNAQIEAGVVTNPFGGRIEAWQKFLGIATEAQRKAAAARAEITALNKRASDANNAATGARSQSERLSGLDGVVPTKGGGLSGGSSKQAAKSLFERYNLASTVDMTCADVASKTVERLGFHLKKSVNAGQLEKIVKAAGWVRVDPRTAPLGSLAFKYSATARSRTHAMMGLGGGELASSSNHVTSYFKARGNERVYAPPGAAGGVTPTYRGSSSGGYGTSSPEAAPWFDTSDLGFSNARALGTGWGTPVKNVEGFANRFRFQSQLAKGELQKQLEWIKALVQQGRAQGRTMGPYAENSPANGLMGLEKQGIRVNWKKGWTQDDVALDMLRQLSTGLDLTANATTKQAKAEEKANEARQKAKEGMAAQILDVKNARSEIVKQNAQSQIEIQLLKEKGDYLAKHPGDEEGADKAGARRAFEFDLWRSENSPVFRLFKSGRKLEAAQEAKGLLAGYDKKTAGQDRIDGIKKSAEDAKKAVDDLKDAYTEAIGKFPGVGGLATDATEKLDSILKDSGASAADLKLVLDALPDTIKNIDALPADLKWKVGGDDISGKLAQLRWRFMTQSGTEATEKRTELLAPYKGQQLDLQKQMEAAQMARVRPLSSLQQQNLDWKFEDLAVPKQDASALSAIEKERDAVRALLTEWDKYDAQQSKIARNVDKTVDIFDSMFDSIISGQKSFGATLRDGFQNTLMQLAGDLIKSQFRSLITGLFTGALGGGSSPISTGSMMSFDAAGSIVNGSHAAGLAKVPFDGYKAVLHRSEMILSASEAESYRQNRQAELIAGAGSRSSSSGGDTYVSYTLNGNIVANSPEDIHRQLQANGRRSSGPRRSRFEMARGGQVALSRGKT